MNKKVPEGVEENGVKPNKAKALRTAAGDQDPKIKGNHSLRIVDDPRFAQAVQNYEAGLKAMQAHKYDKAKAHFEGRRGCKSRAGRPRSGSPDQL